MQQQSINLLLIVIVGIVSSLPLIYVILRLPYRDIKNYIFRVDTEERHGIFSHTFYVNTVYIFNKKVFEYIKEWL